MENRKNKLLSRDLNHVLGETEWKVVRNHEIMIFSEDEIKRITSNYSTPIGKGGFGEVYRGILDYDYDLVAVKRYIQGDLIEEFMHEVSIHSKMTHKNVVKLLGYCIGENTLTMVTEFISKGNLDEALHKSSIPIPLDLRLGIAIGCAEALSYMHSMHLSSDNLVCHGDIKPANILLDNNLTAKVSDFGLSRLLLSGLTQSTSNVKGSIDYMDPIYVREGCLTRRSDVYSFGIVLLELITRRRVKQGSVNLVGAFSKAYRKGKGFRELFDAKIANRANMTILDEMGKLAIECLTMEINNRPQMNDVAERLRMLWQVLRGGQGIFWFKHVLDIFKRSRSEIVYLKELGNVRILTKDELNLVTQDYSHRHISWSDYKGTLEDNTLVLVKKVSGLPEPLKEDLINEGMILSHIIHKNILKIVGCCLDVRSPIFIYEYTTKSSVSNILYNQKDLTVDLRMRIAIKTAQALAYIHSSAAGIIGHGRVGPSNILLDDNFVPKLTGFSKARRLINKREITAGDSVISSHFLEDMLLNNPSHYCSVLMKLESDVYDFGILLLSLISRRKNFRPYKDHPADLVVQLTESDRTDDNGKAMFDKDITAHEDITLLEEIGRLAIKCIRSFEIKRPTMKEVAEHLRKIWRYWKEPTAMGTIQVTAIEYTSTEPRLPNLMRHVLEERETYTSLREMFS
ncbi:hypothetical protein ACP4OV_027172 [Aristida adscensionis]